MNEFQRSIFFTKVPLGGYYKYKNVFQIFPLEMEKMPNSPLKKHYPNILEFWITDEDVKKMSLQFGEINLRTEENEEYNQKMEEITAGLRKQDKILALLSAFTNNLFFRYINMEGAWGIPFPVTTESASSEWYINMYHFQELPQNMRINNFTDISAEKVKTMDYKQYYTDNPNLDVDSSKNIVFPSVIDVLFDAYYHHLNSEFSTFIDTAISYNISAMELNDNKKTLSLLSSFTAMETMVNLDYRNVEAEKCSECGQLKYSVSKKYREYLLKYLGNSPANKKKFNSYYSLRSKIVHTGERLKTEQLFSDVPQEEKEKEFLTRIEILQLGKLSVIQWLLKNK